MTEPPAIVRHKFVERINQWGQPECFEQTAKPPQSRQFGQQGHAPTGIAREGRAE